MPEENPNLDDAALSADEEEQIKEYLGLPKAEEKLGVFQFFNEVRKTGDSSKVSNLDDNEKEAVLILKHINRYTGKLWGIEGAGNYYSMEAEEILSVADSKKGFLIKQVGTQRREIKSKVEGEEKKKKKGWFRGSEPEGEE